MRVGRFDNGSLPEIVISLTYLRRRLFGYRLHQNDGPYSGVQIGKSVDIHFNNSSALWTVLLVGSRPGDFDPFKVF